MEKKLHRIAAAASVCTVTALFAACGGGGGGGGGGLYSGKTTPANITAESVKSTLASVTDIFPSCSATGVTKTALDTTPVLSVVKIAQKMLPPTVAKKSGKSVALLSTTAPPTKNGDCGGTLSYPTYSHAGGDTTMSVKWDNYCTTDISTGNKTTLNGTLSAFDDGTPGANGPVTAKLTASIPNLTVVEKNAAGTIISSETITLSGFEYVPAAGASSSDPTGTIKLSSFEAVDNKNNKQYKLENMNVTTSKVGAGAGADTQVTLSGRIYRGTSGYSDLATETPLVIDSNENLKAGAISFSAGTHKATLTAVPGTGQTFTADVDGNPIAGAQLTCSGL